MLKREGHLCLKPWDNSRNNDYDSVASNFVPRDYQIEMLKCAKKQNTIVMMPTGSGKTYVALLLIKHFLNQTMSDPWKGIIGKECPNRKCSPAECSHGDKNWKRTFFLVNQVTLVSQQAIVLRNHTGVSVGCYHGGSPDIDASDKISWYSEFLKNQILVMTAGIFKSIVESGTLSVHNVNVLVLDECHHAKENHLMAQIMRDHWKIEKPSGRVLGLTASVIDKKKAVESYEIQQSIEKLQKMLGARLITPKIFVNQMDDIKLPEHEIKEFNNNDYCKNLLAILDSLQQTVNSHSIKSFPEEEKSTFVHIKKIVTSLPKIILEIGIDSLHHNLLDERGYIAEISNYLASPLIAPLKDQGGNIKECMTYRIGTVILSQLKCLSNSVENIIDRKLEVRMSVKFYSLVKFLIELYQSHSINAVNGDCPKVIIFVERRRVVMAMFKYLQQLRSQVEAFANMKASYVLGGSSGGGEKDGVYSEFELADVKNIQKQQDQALLDFREGKSNILIASSVVEEGLDIPKCNVVIRYDFPPTYRAYVQSRGRARKLPARFVFFISKNELEEKNQLLHGFNEIEKLLKKYASDQNIDNSENDDDDYEEDYNRLIPSFEITGSGAKITAMSAIQRLNYYCSQLPKDEYTQTNPTCETHETAVGMFQTSILLPKLCPVSHLIEGEEMPNKKLAKMSAAMKALRVLHDAKELDDSLLPFFRQKESNTLLIEAEDGRCISVDQKLKVPSLLWRNDLTESSARFNLYSINLNLQPSIEDFAEYFNSGKDHKVSCFGILSKTKLPDFPNFEVYPRYGKVKVSIQFEREMVIPLHVLASYYWFQEALFTHILDLPGLKMWEGIQFKTFFVLPLRFKVKGFQFNSAKTQGSCHLDIDSKFINQLKKQWDAENHRWIYGNIPDDLSKCLDSVLFTAYNYSDDHSNKDIREGLYSVIKLSDLTAKDHLKGRPKDGVEVETYEEYHFRMHKIRLKNPHNRLLQCKYVTRHYDYSHFKEGNKETYTRRSDMNLVAEIQLVHPMPASLWNQATCLPTVLWRMETFCLSSELTQLLYNDSNLNVSLLSSQYSNYFAHEGIENLKDMLRRDVIYTGDIDWLETLHGLTHQACKEPYNLERYEFLGDRFLKLIGTLYYYRTMPDKHEGWLTKYRSQLISNQNLSLRSSKSIKLPRFILNKNINPGKNWIPPCHIPDYVARKLDEAFNFLENESSNDQLQQEILPEDTTETVKLKKKIIESQKLIAIKDFLLKVSISDSSNPEILMKLCEVIPEEYLQSLQMKDVADSMEALLGLCVAKYGYRRTVDLLDRIEITTFQTLKKGGVEKINDHIYLPTQKSQVWSLAESGRQFALSQYESLRIVEKTINYTFKDPFYLVEALTHASFPEIDICYQRLEFLGDAVLDVLMVFHIYEDLPQYDQGQMTNLLSSLVCNTTLSKICTKLKLHQSILYNSPELYNTLARFYANFSDTELEDWCKDLTLDRVFVESVSNDVPGQIMPIDLDNTVVQTPKILGDIVESIIGAVYLDSGEDMNCVWRVIWPWFSYFYDQYRISPPKNCKVLVNEAYPHLERKVVSYPGDSYRCIAIVSLATRDENMKVKKYVFKTIGRDQETAMEVSYGRAWHFHRKYLIQSP